MYYAILEVFVRPIFVQQMTAQLIKNTKAFLALGMLLFPSCESGMEEQIEVDIDRIDVEILPFSPDTETRSSVQFSSASDYKPFVNRQDTLGIFSFDQVNDRQQAFQLAFPIKEDNVTSFSFTGGGWKMLPDYNYQAYCPFSYDTREASRIVVKMSGQMQDKFYNSGELINHLSQYLYMTSTKKDHPVNGELSITMGPIINFVRLQVISPAAATYSKISMMSDNEDFYVLTHYNLETLQFDNSDAKKSKAHSLKLNNLSASKDEQLYFYTCLAPTSVTSATWKVVLETTSGETYVSELSSYRSYPIGGKKDVVVPAFVKQQIDVPNNDLEGVTGTASDFVLAN